jgi:thiol:disulfide interchange protein DsbD
MSLWLRRAHAPRLLCALLFCASALAVTGIGVARAAVDESDLLPVDQAFALTATAPDRGRIELNWKIADGYYLYRHRIAVQSVDGAFRADPLQLPHGQKHHDEFFGEVETFRGQLVAVQAGAAAAGADHVTLKVKYQGCADAGVCYPPQTRTLTVALPPAASVAAGGNAGLGPLGTTSGKGLLLGGAAAGPGEPLPEAQAFAFEAIVGDGNTLLLRFTPARGYYLYRDKTSLKLEGADGIAAGKPRWPRGVKHRDEHFGETVVYFDQVDVPLPLQRTRTDAANVRLTATFQGCQTDGICYPPMTRTVALSLPVGNVDAVPVGAASAAIAETPDNDSAPIPADATPDSAIAADAAPTTNVSASRQAEPLAEDSRLAAALAGKSRWLALLGFFGAGLLLAFTPCGQRGCPMAMPSAPSSLKEVLSRYR